MMTNLDLKARANELAQETQKRIAGGCYCEPGQGPHYYDFEDAIAAAIRAGMREAISTAVDILGKHRKLDGLDVLEATVLLRSLEEGKP